jgi:hypothetical protein
MINNTDYHNIAFITLKFFNFFKIMLLHLNKLINVHFSIKI